MGVLEEVTQMKNQGMSETDISNSLTERGISPKEINDALSQSQIKSAVSQEGFDNPPIPQKPTSTPSYTPQTREVEGSGYPPQQELYSPQPLQEYAPQEQYLPQEQYADYSQATETDTMIEVAEQVFFEKIQKIGKQVEKLTEFKTLSQTKIQTIEERLKKIESIINKLQIAILDKIGSYGRNLESIKKEMSMMQDSFGKVVNQAVRGERVSIPKKTVSHKKPTRKKTSKKK